MLQKVHDFWVKGVLENSLHKAALIDLGMAYQPDAVAYPWEMVVERPDATPQPLPQGTPIASVFDELRGELLILGSPGSGKTTMLLELARTLIKRAQQEETHPIPVVFNLSSWAEKRPPLADWLVEELNARYDVPRKVGQAWIDHDQVLPLLDGLDEARQDARDACVEAINAYRQEHGLIGMVVCSRVADYAALTAKLKLRGAIMVQPLTDEQIDWYLAQAGDQLSAVRTLLHEDAEMRVFANTPLMLSIMSLAYQGVSTHALPEPASLNAQRRHLFDTYVERMLRRRGGDQCYTPEQTRHWLSWLAGRMVEQGQTIFYLDQMQPDWLQSLTQQQVVTLGTSGLLGIMGGLIFVLGSMLSGGLNNGIFVLLGFLCVSTLFGGLLGYSEKIKPIEATRWSLTELKAELSSFLIAGIKWRSRWITIIGFGLVAVLGGAIVGGVTGAVMGGTVGILVIFWGAIWIGGVSRREVSLRTTPSQGVYRSVRIALISGLIGMSIVLLNGLLVGMLFSAVHIGLILGAVGGCIGGLGVALKNGGLAVLQHYTLRLILWFCDSIPLNYVHFLDHAAERILLRKVGGGYIFVHRMLLEYFAGLEPEQQRKNESEAAQ
jgi:DNA polymerase III delta prime subunit